MHKDEENNEESNDYENAATVMLLTETKAGIQTLLLRRNAQLKFAGGNWVFPGGRIDQADYDPGDPQNILLAARNAAVRETKEETGLIIGRENLFYFSRWLAPPIHTRRFDTWFFLAVVDELEIDKVVVDGGEIHEHQWMTAEQGLAAHSSGELPLLPPTYVSMWSINRFSLLSDVFRHYNSREPFYFNPRLDKQHQSSNEFLLLYEGDAGYESSNGGLAGWRHRVVMNNGKVEYFCDLENSDSM